MRMVRCCPRLSDLAATIDRCALRSGGAFQPKARPVVPDLLHLLAGRCAPMQRRDRDRGEPGPAADLGERRIEPLRRRVVAAADAWIDADRADRGCVETIPMPRLRQYNEVRVATVAPRRAQQEAPPV